MSRARRSAFAGSRAEQELRQLAHPVRREPAADALARDEAHARRLLAHLRERLLVRIEVELRDEAQAADEPQRILGEAVRRDRPQDAALEVVLRPSYGSTSVPSERRRAIALTVKSRRSQVVLDGRGGVDDDLEVVAAGAGRDARAAAARTRCRRARAAAPPRRAGRGARRRAGPATTSSSMRPCGSSAARSPAMSTPGTRKSASFDSTPEQLVAHRAADDVRVEPERRDVVLDRLHDASRAAQSRARSPRSRPARPRAAWRPRPSSAPAASSPTCFA